MVTATTLMANGLCEIVEKFDLDESGPSPKIRLKVRHERVRTDSDRNRSTSNDFFSIIFWSSAAKMIAETAEVGDSLSYVAEIRNRVETGFTIKPTHFEIYKKDSNSENTSV